MVAHKRRKSNELAGPSHSSFTAVDHPLPLSALWFVGLVSAPPVRKERMLLSVVRGGDLFTQFRRFGHEVIKPSQDATKDGIARIFRRHAT